MPIYEFVCEACGRITEVMQKVNDPAPAACPECGAGKLARLVSRTTFQLKGGGWYSDLYASAKKKPEPAGTGAAEPKGGAAAAAAATAPAAPAATGTPPASGSGKGDKGGA